MSTARPIQLAPNLALRHNSWLQKAFLPHALSVKGIPMVFDLYLGGAMAIGLGLYLIYALINPEKF